MTVRAEFERQWTDWLSRLRAIPPERTRESGVAGKWTAHDVVNHVHVCARYYLSQARGAFSGVDPTEEDWYGPRVAPEEGLLPEDGSTDTRNENIRRRGQSVSWDYLLGEAAWLRAESLAWVDGHSAADLDEPLGWSPVWDRALIVRRVRDVPGLRHPEPAWRFVLGSEHLTGHLDQLRLVPGE